MNRPDRQADAEVDDAEFLTSTRDRVQARAFRKQLQQLARGEAGGTLQEMAKEVLAGRVGLREALRVPAYAEALGERVNTFRKDWERMSPEEQKAQREGAQRFLDAQRDEIEREQDEKQKPVSGSAKHSSRGWQL